MNLNKISRYIPTIHCMSQSKDAIIYNTHNFSDWYSQYYYSRTDSTWTCVVLLLFIFYNRYFLGEILSRDMNKRSLTRST